jgi:hypothetical protein
MADAPAPGPDLGLLLAFGRHWQQQLAQPLTAALHLPRPLLDHFVRAANEALAFRIERDAKKETKPHGGRPSGGMGAEVLQLMAAGMDEATAVRIVAEKHGKDILAVMRALEYERAKNPPK